MLKGKLSSFIESCESDLSKQKIQIIDFGNLVHRCFFVCSGEYSNKRKLYLEGVLDSFQSEDDMFGYWKHLVLNNILTTVFEIQPDKMIVAVDSRENWRKTVYAEYKANRKETRDASDLNWDRFYIELDKLTTEMNAIFTNMYVIKVDKCEADDIIAVLVKDFCADKNNTVELISTDGDFVQLHTFKNFKQFDPIKKTYLNYVDANFETEVKILCGDKGDNIPNVKTNSWQEKVRFGPKTAEKVLNEGLDAFLSEANHRQNYMRNKELISFDFIPIDIANSIRSAYSAYSIEPLNSNAVWNWFITNDLTKLSEDWQRFYPIMKNLK